MDVSPASFRKETIANGKIVVYTVTSLNISALTEWNDDIIAMLQDLDPDQQQLLVLYDLSQKGVGLPFLVLNSYKIFNIGVTPMGQRQAAHLLNKRPDLQVRLAVCLSSSASGHIAGRRGIEAQLDDLDFDYRIFFEREAALEWLEEFLTMENDPL